MPAPIATKPKAAISLPSDFRFDQVLPAPRTSGPSSTPPSLGPLVNFVGSWDGSGFNTIFRPDNPESSTAQSLPTPVPTLDNILELNLTSESLTFSPSLGSVPNRGSNVQKDIFLNGVPYLQAISDVTTGAKIGIHLEPGLWMMVPATTGNPVEGPTLVRMASIPHGTTIEAQGTSITIAGAPNIPKVDITPFITGSTQASSPVKFASQTASNSATQRIPQNLSGIAITQAMLDDPNSVLRSAISQQKIVSTIQISISTNPAAPLFGGGTDNIAFLQGDPTASPDVPTADPNAQTLQMTATFWIETVEHTITIPPSSQASHHC